VRYTRNMATGASTADLALVVIDVASGLKEQTRRHLCIAALLGVRSIIVAINKMDTVGWSELAFQSVVDQFETLSRELGFSSTVAIPVSALLGDNVATNSTNTRVRRPSVLDALETSEAGSWEIAQGARLPIQWSFVNPAVEELRCMVSGEAFHVGDKVTLLPKTSKRPFAPSTLAGTRASRPPSVWPRTSISMTRLTRDAATSSPRTRCRL